MDRIIDSHVHLRLLYKYNPERIDWLISHGCTVISWAFGGNIAGASDLNRYLRGRLRVFEDLRERGLDCYHLCGIHPRKIPPDLKPEAVGEILAPFLDDPHCLGIGEIGLETGSLREQEIFLAQVEFGLSLDRPNLRFGIHTPRQKKQEITDQLLSLLEAYPAFSPVAVIDHCSPETIGQVLAGGYHAGISLSSTKSTREEMVAMVTAHKGVSRRIMCNTDSSREFYEDLVEASQCAKLETMIAEEIFFATTHRFFNIEDSG